MDASARASFLILIVALLFAPLPCSSSSSSSSKKLIRDDSPPQGRLSRNDTKSQNSKEPFPDNPCSGHGRGKDENICICDSGYDGVDCQLDTSQKSTCSNGQFDINGDCCDSGIFEFGSGSCCKGDNFILDKNGRCCDGVLDACGFCNGSGFVDAIGDCCQTILDASGLCCKSGYVDECGICNGLGNSCKTVLTVQLTIDEQEATTLINAEQCINTWISSILSNGAFIVTSFVTSNFSLFVFDIDITNAHVNADSIENMIEISDITNSFNPCNVSQILSSTKYPICNNAVCEVGEVETCPQDCPYQLVSCNNDESCAGRGICLLSNSGMCACFPGYEGDHCEKCSYGYYPYKNVCLQRQWAAIAQQKQADNKNSNVKKIQEINLKIEKSSDVIVERSTVIAAKSLNSSSNSEILFIAAPIAVVSFLIFIIAIALSYHRQKMKQRDKQKQRDTQRSNTDSYDILDLEAHFSPRMAKKTNFVLSTTDCDEEPLKDKDGRTLVQDYLKRWIEFQKNPQWIGDLYSTASS